jgi:ligand-binding SRPBCC domain-containing protein
MMKEFTFHTELWLPRQPAEVFPFFAEAKNLEAITPPWLEFETLTPGPVLIEAGALIDYRIRIHGIPIRWRTEIALWDPPVSSTCNCADRIRSGITHTRSWNAMAARFAPMTCGTVRAAER